MLHLPTDSLNECKFNIGNLIKDEFNLDVQSFNDIKFDCVYSLAANNAELNTSEIHKEILVIGDIEIHNKQQLIDKYNLIPSYTSEDIVASLYKSIGISSVRELIGEFSFILYDSFKKLTYAVRDHLGVKTLFWCKTSTGYLFASDLFLLKQHLVRNDLEIEYFKEFYHRKGIVDSELTPFKNSYRVKSGNYLSIENNHPKLYEYWSLNDITGQLVYKYENDYIDEFRELLKNAVDARLTRNNLNSVMLSGGLDSTSIYALTKEIEQRDPFIKTSSVSAIFEELKEADESKYIKDFLNKYKEEGIYLNCDNVLMFSNFPTDSPFTYEPYVNSITFNFTNSIVERAVSHGYSNILTGYAGDHLLNGTMYVTGDLMRSHKIKESLSYITNYSIRTNTKALQNLKNYIFYPNVTSSFFASEDSEYYRQHKKRIQGIKQFNQQNLYLQISNAKSHLYLDRVIGARLDSDIRHPFLDRRVIEYIYKVPGHLIFTEKGVTKNLLRKAMASQLTKEIVERSNKTTHLSHTYKSIIKSWDKIYSNMYPPKIINVLKLISSQDWESELLKWRNGVPVGDDFWVLFSMEAWFNAYNNRFSKKLV